MLPQKHILIGLIFSAVLYFVFPGIGILNLAILFGASFLIDVDHYLYYVYRSGDWSLRNAVVFSVEKRRELRKLKPKIREQFYYVFPFLHGIELVVLSLLAGYFFFEIFYFVGLGFLLHLIADHVDALIYGDSFSQKISTLYGYFAFKKLKRI